MIMTKNKVICPTHYNSNEFFSFKKPTLMVYCENNFFEPLCKMTRKNNRKLLLSKNFSHKKHLKCLKHTAIFDTIIKKIKIFKRKLYSKKSIGFYDYVQIFLRLKYIEF